MGWANPNPIIVLRYGHGVYKEGQAGQAHKCSVDVASID